MTTALPSRSFDHDVFVHDADEGYIAALVPLLQGALERSEAATAVVSSSNAALLAKALGAQANRVEFISAEGWYMDPVTTITAYDTMLATAPVGKRNFVIGEVQFGGEPAAWTAWTRYESLLNNALSGYDAHVVCPYDRRVLPPAVVEDALRTHPFVVDATARQASGSYAEPELVIPSLPATVDVPERAPDLEIRLKRSLREARHLFSAITASAGFGREHTEELTLAINEIATNALTHGRGPGLMQLWVDPEGLTCVISDHGAGASPAIGYKPPPLGSTSGYGLWLSRRIFDRVDTLAEPDGFRVALFASSTSAPAVTRAKTPDHHIRVCASSTDNPI